MGLTLLASILSCLIKLNIEETLDYYQSGIFYCLLFFLILSLCLPFYSKASPVHKVIALLLLSVVTVFLWVYETQFLFIYLVYILAFVGAVLMLFLSVVLILPISTIRSDVRGVVPVIFSTNLRPILPDQGYFSFFKLEPSDILVQFSSSFVLVAAFNLIVFIAIYNWLFNLKISFTLQKKFDILKTYSDFLEYLIIRCAVSNKFTGSNTLISWFGLDKNSDKIPVSFISLPVTYYFSILQTAVNAVLLLIASAYCLLFFKLYHIISSNSGLLVSKLTTRIISFYFFVTSYCVIECFTMLYLFVNFSLLVVPESNFNLKQSSLEVNNVLSGLELIRFALYDQTGLFLLLSTIVLLVSLIGVAVITRNKK